MTNRKCNAKCFSSISKIVSANLKKVKAGIDTNVLIDLIENYESMFFFNEKFQPHFNILYTHRACLGEARGILINEFGYTPKQAEVVISDLIRNLNIKIIERKKSHRESEHIVHEIGEKHGLNHKTKVGKTSLDYIIITGFWREKVTIILSIDNAFLKTCKELNMNTMKMPTRDRLIERKLKSFSRKKHP